MNDYLQEMW